MFLQPVIVILWTESGTKTEARRVPHSLKVLEESRRNRDKTGSDVTGLVLDKSWIE